MVPAVVVWRTAPEGVVARDALPRGAVAFRTVRHCARKEEAREREIRRVRVVQRDGEQVALQEVESASLVLERDLSATRLDVPFAVQAIQLAQSIRCETEHVMEGDEPIEEYTVKDTFPAHKTLKQF